ncbi:MAG: 2-C-methyl-D-erythritol 4-phosphate cytidylyltransferase [Bacteroidetes bacterium GWE2_41_25]|nr:MAG: 2-C-methyl-D-erythritol 4-phosphate cytidylyltransferase [Bacteroidetes bacterium GWA2_40_15]OFX92460.1 MAG: 2-C-methyl-D-erythritol 4-phosphate cytidylyltransferase [Bacteroidetes bacterium GWC2_40_22]OFX92602.1 MAG: 2-C-methyl-D-erythritol 4-phosphate cytidylyltransferase [Bacteroidetes bacterium GWE2_41_25]OFY58339.1 MAG: 2-C-methyl-D-erythritol 4-phosphate cytidylyltransferase [Bacteroidetes bacterium GWF2_41_9]HAM09333.1 2-C-methyl-D-erythritol 4-phosphate cytidylyltransferase [Bac
MQFYVVIVAGGSGKRMGAEIPKQFLELAGRPVLMHTIERFKSFNDSVEIITVLPEDQLRHWIELKEKYSFNVPETLVKGGSHRFDSVKNGLQFVNVPGVVAIHDGVRPFVSIETIKRCFETAEKLGNAIPSISITESLRMISDKGSNPINRLLVRQIQTPQVFSAELLKKAYLLDYKPEYTDDATVLESIGEKINLVEGNRENIKITNPEDLIISTALLPTIS